MPNNPHGSRLTADLASAQERAHADADVWFRVWTEDVLSLRDTTISVVGRYFGGATINYATGIWQGGREAACVIDIIAMRADWQRVADLAGDLRCILGQQSVLVTAIPVTRLDCNGQ